ncbi:hypothetical protein [Microbacterium rhizophilus]|uniref:hypothetical protein n=1 Tax=Microbacterium rhizophilus TaxID=3138934 RepID=UPI0031E66059
MDLDDTVVTLWRACDRWEHSAQRLEQIADAGFPGVSRLGTDNKVATVGESSLAVSRYIQERMWNSARMLRSAHRQVFATEPGRFHLDATVLYPLMRAAMEDATTIVWFQAPEGRNARLIRMFRALFTDSHYFTENHLLLAAAAPAVGAVPLEVGDALSVHMTAEQESTRAHFKRLAGELGLDPDESTRKLSTREPIKVQYGADSVELATWKFLSDLSHFSFMMLRHLATTPIPGTTVPLLHATMLQFAQTLNRVCDDAVEHIERAGTVGEE